MGFSDWFNFKSREERERETREYERWAFPYGQPQKNMISGIVKQLLPEENTNTAMAVYLIGREGYRGSMKADPETINARSREERLKRTMRALQPHLPGRHKKLMSRYVALILADDKIGPEMEYPTVDELKQAASELESVLKNIPI